MSLLTYQGVPADKVDKFNSTFIEDMDAEILNAPTTVVFGMTQGTDTLECCSICKVTSETLKICFPRRTQICFY